MSKTNKKPAQEDSVRLQTILDLLHISGNKLSKILEYKAPASVYHVLEGRNKMSAGMIEGIIEKFPEVSYSYLKTGKGEPRLSNDSDRRAQRNLFRHVYKDEPTPSKENTNDDSDKQPDDTSKQLQVLINNSTTTNYLLGKILQQIESLDNSIKFIDK